MKAAGAGVNFDLARMIFRARVYYNLAPAALSGIADQRRMTEMGVENFVKPVESKRSTKRARVLLAARLQTPFGEVEARLRDLSRKGALLECAKVPPVGSEVVFIRGSTVVPARVAWTGADRVGLEFLYMIDEHEVLVQLKKAPQRSLERFRRPGLNESLSAHERKIAQAWGVTVGINLPESEI